VYKHIKLSHWIALSMLAGVMIGQLCHLLARDPAAAKAMAGYFSIISDIFLRLVKMIIAPLVFATVVSGVSNMDDTQSIGRIALKTLAWFVAGSFISLSVGLLFVNLMQPGSGMDLPLPEAGGSADLPTAGFDIKEFVTTLFPKSFFEATAGNHIVQILIFSLFFGLALRHVRGEGGRIVRHAVDGLLGVMLHMTKAVMGFAPLGVFAALAAVISVQGLAVLAVYGKFLGSFYAALASLWAVLLLVGYIFLNRRMWDLVRLIREPVMIAFSTASSEAAYPAMTDRLRRFGIDKRLVGFVLPLGYSFNLVGSMVYQAFAAVFIAQAFHVPMTLTQQITMLLILMVSSKGMAAVPRGALAVLAAIMPMFGLPEAGLALVLGIDQFMDMGRTATNVLGNSIATSVIAKWEGALAPEQGHDLET
jgi:Na+/H+-dicarboxylate symporter